MRWLDTAVCLFPVFYLLRGLLRMPFATEASIRQRVERRIRSPLRGDVGNGFRYFLWSSGFFAYAALRAQLAWWWASLTAVSTTCVLLCSVMLIFLRSKHGKQTLRERAARAEAPIDWPRRLEVEKRTRRVSAAVAVVFLASWTYSWSHLVVGGGESRPVPAFAGVLVAVLLVAGLFWPFRAVKSVPRTLDLLEDDIRFLLRSYPVGAELMIIIDQARSLRLTRRWLGTHAGVTLGLPNTSWFEQHLPEVTAICDAHGWTVDRDAESDENTRDLLHVRFGADATTAAACVRAILTRVLGLPVTATVYMHGPLPGEERARTQPQQQRASE